MSDIVELAGQGCDAEWTQNLPGTLKVQNPFVVGRVKTPFVSHGSLKHNPKANIFSPWCLWCVML